MARIHFIYSTMNAGKSTALLQTNFAYLEKGMRTVLFTSKKTIDMEIQKLFQELG